MAHGARRADHGNGNVVELGRVVAPIAKVIGGLIGLVVVTAAAVGAYYTLIGNVNEIRQEQRQQGKILESLAGSIQKLADEALTSSDLRAACMQMQISNRGWICPLSGVDLPNAARRAVPKAPAAPVAGPFSLFTK